MVAATAGRKGRPWRRTRAAILDESDLCHWCGHHGADAVDHITPIAAGGSRTDPANLAPIHGINGCPTCGMKCNSSKGGRLDAVRPPRTSRAW